MTNNEIRKFIREIIIEKLDEMSTTGGIAGYSTPHAFSGKKNKRKGKNKNKTEIVLVQRGLEEVIKRVDIIDEAISKYATFKKIPDRTAKQKIGLSIREVKKSLREIDIQFKILSRFKNEMGISSNNYWKRTLKDIYKIDERLLKISQKLREF